MLQDGASELWRSVLHPSYIRLRKCKTGHLRFSKTGRLRKSKTGGPILDYLKWGVTRNPRRGVLDCVRWGVLENLRRPILDFAVLENLRRGVVEKLTRGFLDYLRYSVFSFKKQLKSTG